MASEGTAKYPALRVAHDQAWNVEIKKTVKLKKNPTHDCCWRDGLTAYFVEHTDHYPGCGWLGSESKYDDPSWFGDGLIRNLATAMESIVPVEVLKRRIQQTA